MLAGISFRMIFPNIVSPLGLAACAFAISSAMFPQVESPLTAAFSNVTKTSAHWLAVGDDAFSANWPFGFDFLVFRR